MIKIGEKLNGAIKSVAQAIERRDAAFLQQRAKQQQDAGADYLDICAAVKEAELDTLCWMIDTVQSVSDLPLCVDSPDPAVCVAAMKNCTCAGMINSVSMEGNKTEIVFPAIADTDWSVVALLCDDNGIPADADGRLAVLDRILARAAQYGIAEDRIYVDPLVEALSANPSAFLIFCDCVRRIRAQHPQIHIVSGMSNISFGLPKRKQLHGAFLQLAAEAGMDAAICDPADAELAADPLAIDALLGRDAGCRAYIEAYAAPRVQQSDDTPAAKLMAAVTAGQKEQTADLTRDTLAAGASPMALLDGMTDTMGKLGERFARGEVFIPELIMASHAMQAAAQVLKPLLGGSAATRGTAIIGTVMGDMHDIGKNLVAMMLEGAGFSVVDLGTDVYPEDFVDAAIEHPDTKIIALSALLTTTMAAMEETVQAIRGEPACSGIKIMVGGAPVTRRFAEQIGADAYADNAATAAEEAKRLAIM